MLLDAHDSQLVLIDFQERLMPAIQDGPVVLGQAQRLAEVAALMDVPVWATEQNPDRLGGTAPTLRAMCRQVTSKQSFSGAAGLLPLLRPVVRVSGNARSLPRHLQRPAAEAPSRGCVVLAGVEAHVCLLQTALELMDEDFEVWVVTDACGARHVRDRDAAFDRLAAAGAELVTVEMVAFEWLRTADHPRFKAVQALIK